MPKAERVSEIGLDPRAFGACLAGHVDTTIRQDAAEAKAFGFSGTPAFVVGVKLSSGHYQVLHVIVGNQPVDTFRTAIDDALRQGHP
jgi:protein-disulfide isomerase